MSYIITCMREEKFRIHVIKTLIEGEVDKMNCTKTNSNEESGWVIKDQNNHFTHMSSIKKIGRHGWQYIAFKSFTEVCRWYEDKQSAELALFKLNRKMSMVAINFVFHIEQQNLNIIINEGENSHNFNNMVKYVGTIGNSALVEAI